MRGICHHEDWGWSAALRIPVGAAVIGSGLLSAGSSLVGSGKSSSASKSSANEQLAMYEQTRSDLSPYNTTGQSALSGMLSLAQGSPTGGGTDYVTAAANAQPGTLTEAQLQQVPGYQFTLNQGLKSAANSYAARGLGVSGAALKGAASYATGLADSTYQDAFNQQQTQFSNLLNLNTAQQSNLQNQFTRLQNVASLGESAAAMTGQQGTQAASNYGGYTSLAGTQSAAGTTGASNAITSSANNLTSYNLLAQYLGGSGASGGYQSANTSSGAAQGFSNAGYYGSGTGLGYTDTGIFN